MCLCANFVRVNFIHAYVFFLFFIYTHVRFLRVAIIKCDLLAPKFECFCGDIEIENACKNMHNKKYVFLSVQINMSDV